MTTPKLQFGPEVTPTGFAATATALFNDLRPARIVRELLQNSIDAAADANESVAHVRFRITLIGEEDIPDINGYTKAVREAIEFGKTRGRLSTPDQQIVDQIEGALERLADSDHYMLSIMDNGVGLDKKRMTAILGDGISNKSGVSAGSYGVGHFTAVPTSDLRYLLYGGVQASGRRVAAGAAFLASREGSPSSGHLRAARGYLIKGFDTGQSGKVFEFIDPAEMPLPLADDLRTIRRNWRHGTVIHIPAFNWFRDKDEAWSLWDIVSKVAAYNFVVAIQRGQLQIEVDEDSAYEEPVGVQTLDKNSIESVLDAEREKKYIAGKSSFLAGLRPSGQVAHSIYQVLIRGESHVVKTKFGDVPVQLLVPSPTGRTRVDLVRNGMWITDSLQDLQKSDFTGYQTFHAVLMPKSRGELHRLIRKAEGPMHNELSFKHLDDKLEKERLRDGLHAVRDWIRGHVPEIGTEEYTPDDFLVVETGGEANGRGSQRFSMYGTPVVVQGLKLSSGGEEPPSPNPRPTPRPKPRPRPRPPPVKPERPSRPLPFQSIVVPQGRNAHVVSLQCTEDADEVSLSLRLHENVDATCDRIWPDQVIAISRFTFRGTERPPRADRGLDGKEVTISGLVAGEIYEMAIEHEAVDVAEDVGGGSALSVVLHRPRPSDNS